MGARRLVAGYATLLAACGGIAAASLTVGSGKEAEPRVSGSYRLPGGVLLELRQSGQFVDAGAGCGGKLRLRHGHLRGRFRCGRRSGPVDLVPVHGAPSQLRGSYAGRAIVVRFVADLPKPGTAVQRGAPPTNEQLFGRLMLAIAAVILAARGLRALIGRIGQPPVMGEVLAGILLGPTLLGAVAPGVKDYLFPSFVLPLLTAGADIGLAFYMFLVGLELDPRLLKGRVGQAAAISNASIVLPLALGMAAAVPLYTLLAPPTRFVAFALFMGVAMSITAFPVLARILIERRMLKTPIGALALSSAAVDDVTAWGLLALASGVALHGSAFGFLPVLGYVFAFCGVMAVLGRPLLARVSRAYDEAGQVPAGWIAAIFVGVLLSSYASMKSGVAPIFGAFVMGLIMPRRADLSHDVTRRLEDFVSTVLLPLFFVVTGLRTQVGLLDRPILWLITGGLVVVASVGKWLGAMLAARLGGYPLRDSAVIGALMNTRGLTELIVLNIGLELDVISPALFTMLVLMALVTTFMTAPILRLLDPRKRLTSPPEEELRSAAVDTPSEFGAPERSLLVCPLAEQNLDALLLLAEPLARSRPPRADRGASARALPDRDRARAGGAGVGARLA